MRRLIALILLALLASTASADPMWWYFRSAQTEGPRLNGDIISKRGKNVGCGPFGQFCNPERTGE